MGEEGLVKLIESLSEEVVEAIDRRVCGRRGGISFQRQSEQGCR